MAKNGQNGVSKGLLKGLSKGLWMTAGILAVYLATTLCGPVIPAAYAQTPIEVTLSDTGISPATLTAKKSELLEMHVVNRGTKVHNFVIPAFFIFTSNLQPGTDTNVKFSPAKTGTFPYYSDTGGTPEPGLRGTLTVR